MKQTIKGVVGVVAATAAAGMLIAGCSSSTNSSTSATTSAAAGATSEAAGGANGGAAPGTGAESGVMGMPGAPTGGSADRTTINTPAGDFTVQGEILKKYDASGGEHSALGLPTSNEEPAPGGGQYSNFAGGSIYWTPATGAHIVWGKIRDAWTADGGAAGKLGYPTSDEHTIANGMQSDFQHGTITYINDQTEVHPS